VLPYGIQTSASLQSEPGGQLLTNWNIARGATYNTTDPSKGLYWAKCVAPCVPGAVIVPSLTTASLTTPLIPSGYEFLDTLRQLDLKFAKLFTHRSVKMTGQFEIFNATNSSAVLTLRNSTTTGLYYGTPTYHQPGDIPQGRLYKVGMQIKW